MEKLGNEVFSLPFRGMVSCMSVTMGLSIPPPPPPRNRDLLQVVAALPPIHRSVESKKGPFLYRLRKTLDLSLLCKHFLERFKSYCEGVDTLQGPPRAHCRDPQKHAEKTLETCACPPNTLRIPPTRRYGYNKKKGRI